MDHIVGIGKFRIIFWAENVLYNFSFFQKVIKRYDADTIVSGNLLICLDGLRNFCSQIYIQNGLNKCPQIMF